MSAKRAAAKEWKRKRRRQRLMVRLGVTAFCVLAVAGMGYLAWDMWSRTYVMTFEGQRISTADMRFFTNFASILGGGADPRVQGLDQLTQFLLIDQAAQRHNITVTEEEIAQIEENLEFLQMIGLELPDIPHDRIVELMSMDTFSEQLMDIYAADYTIDEVLYQTELFNFLAANRVNFIDMDFRVHISETMTAARIAWDDFAAADPEDFDEIIMRDMQLTTGIDASEFDASEFEEAFVPTVPTITLEDLRENPDISPSVVDYLTSLAVGEFSEPVQIAEDFIAIFIADSFYMPPDEEMAEVFREQYIRNQRIQIFSDVIEDWRGEADIQINQRGINAIGSGGFNLS